MSGNYDYWMVYLRDVRPDTFLLFVDDQHGRTKLRDFSSGRELVLGQPPARQVFEHTTLGRTRFSEAVHTVENHRYWYQKTLEYNCRHLAQRMPATPAGTGIMSKTRTGLAQRGSQRQLQEYVNQHQDELTQAVLEALPARLRELGARLEWVSPLSADQFREYRDADFLQQVGLGHLASALARFWPAQGPSWDALARVYSWDGKLKSGVVLVEAKSHLPELYGVGCQAGAESRSRIQEALDQAKQWCGADSAHDWLGPLYQSANRIAHLHFFRQKQIPAWLVNLYFTADPIGPADEEAWRAELVRVDEALGLTKPVPNRYAVFLPALANTNGGEGGLEQAPLSQLPSPWIATRPAVESRTFASWAERWMALASYTGPTLPDPQRRTEHVLALWNEPVPAGWERGLDTQLLGARYRRGDVAQPRPGEHAIEHEILCQYFGQVQCLGARLVDGINAMPLARDQGGGRTGNVEADLLLLLEWQGAYQMAVCEVKAGSQTPWYAVVENLRQLRLLSLSREAQRVFHRRNPHLQLPESIPFLGLVIAPVEYYESRGQKASSVPATRQLVAEVQTTHSAQLTLATWDSASKSIRKWI